MYKIVESRVPLPHLLPLQITNFKGCFIALPTRHIYSPHAEHGPNHQEIHVSPPPTSCVLDVENMDCNGVVVVALCHVLAPSRKSRKALSKICCDTFAQ